MPREASINTTSVTSESSPRHFRHTAVTVIRGHAGWEFSSPGEKVSECALIIYNIHRDGASRAVGEVESCFGFV